MYFLKRKVMGKKFPLEVITELDIYQYSPWDLPDKSCLRSGDLEWFFFSPRGKKYCSGSRTNRATKTGFWKSTGKDRAVPHNKKTVGKIKTLVFHTGKAPGGKRTNWVNHEYRLEDKDLTNQGIPQGSYVICKVFQKQGLGPRNGAQYGKPFNEQDWNDNDDDVEKESPYEVLCTSSYTALIETIPDKASLHSIKSRYPNISSLREFFNAKYQENSPSFKLAQRNFVESMAGYSLVCYLLQVKDRHNANLLLDEEGHISYISMILASCAPTHLVVLALKVLHDKKIRLQIKGRVPPFLQVPSLVSLLCIGIM